MDSVVLFVFLYFMGLMMALCYLIWFQPDVLVKWNDQYRARLTGSLWGIIPVFGLHRTMTRRQLNVLRVYLTMMTGFFSLMMVSAFVEVLT